MEQFEHNSYLLIYISNIRIHNILLFTLTGLAAGVSLFHRFPIWLANKWASYRFQLVFPTGKCLVSSKGFTNTFHTHSSSWFIYWVLSKHCRHGLSHFQIVESVEQQVQQILLLYVTRRITLIRTVWWAWAFWITFLMFDAWLSSTHSLWQHYITNNQLVLPTTLPHNLDITRNLLLGNWVYSVWLGLLRGQAAGNRITILFLAYDKLINWLTDWLTD